MENKKYLSDEECNPEESYSGQRLFVSMGLAWSNSPEDCMMGASSRKMGTATGGKELSCSFTNAYTHRNLLLP